MHSWGPHLEKIDGEGRFSEEATPIKAVFQVEAVDYTNEEYRLWNQNDLQSIIIKA